MDESRVAFRFGRLLFALALSNPDWQGKWQTVKQVLAATWRATVQQPTQTARRSFLDVQSRSFFVGGDRLLDLIR